MIIAFRMIIKTFMITKAIMISICYCKLSYENNMDNNVDNCEGNCNR